MHVGFTLKYTLQMHCLSIVSPGCVDVCVAGWILHEQVFIMLLFFIIIIQKYQFACVGLSVALLNAFNCAAVQWHNIHWKLFDGHYNVV